MRCNIWAMYINITNQYNDIIYVKLIYYFDLVYNYIRSYQWAELCFSISSQYGAFQRHGGTPKSSSRGWPWLSIGQQPWWLGEFGDPPRWDATREGLRLQSPILGRLSGEETQEGSVLAVTFSRKWMGQMMDKLMANQGNWWIHDCKKWKITENIW